jgi:LysM repeat protein
MSSSITNFAKKTAVPQHRRACRPESESDGRKLAIDRKPRTEKILTAGTAMKWKQHDGVSSPVNGQSPGLSPNAGNGAPDLRSGREKDRRIFDALWFPYVLCGIMLAVAVLLVLLMTTRMKNTAERGRVQRLETRLVQLQSEISRINSAVNKLAGLDNRVIDLSRSLAETRDKLGRLSAETARMRKNNAALRQQLKTWRNTRPPATAGNSSKTIYHRVRRGETLYAIGKRYGTTIKRLQQDNHLAPGDRLHVGQQLKIHLP